MKAITILRRCRAAQGEITRLETRIRQRRELLTSVSAPQADPNGGSRGAGDPDKYGRVTGEIDALEREKRSREEAWQVEQISAIQLLEMVPELEGAVLHLYYVRRMDTGAIARQKKYTAGYVRKMKRSGEQLLDMLSGERVDSTLPPWYLKEWGRREADER